LNLIPAPGVKYPELTEYRDCNPRGIRVSLDKISIHHSSSQVRARPGYFTSYQLLEF
jgi:hypothetical protein